jgi:hypothetical protein
MPEWASLLDSWLEEEAEVTALLDWQTESGLDDEQLAALLSERLGRVITPHGVHTVARRRDPPASWLDALGIAPREPDASPPPREQPVALDDATSRFGLDIASARTQLVLVYTVAGKGAATILQAPAVEGVWATHAPRIADAYIAWAKQNETVARILSYLTLGGPAGELILLHGSLVVTTLIVAERIDVSTFIPRPQAPEEPDEPEPRPEDFTAREPGLEPDADGQPAAEPEPKPRSPRRRPRP